MGKCQKCDGCNRDLQIIKTQKGNLQIMVCLDCGEIESFITESKCTDKTNINTIARLIHANAKAHGWWDDPRSDGEVIALCHAELSEALESFRKGEPAEWFECYPKDVNLQFYDAMPETDMTKYTKEKTEGWATEMVDCVIRIFDYLAYKNIDIESVLLRKHEYNKTRPYKHGKKF